MTSAPHDQTDRQVLIAFIERHLAQTAARAIVDERARIKGWLRDAGFAGAADFLAENLLDEELFEDSPAEPAAASPLPELHPAVRHFAATWRELFVGLPDNYSCALTCSEADAVADVYRALGQKDVAASILASHAAHDEEGDGHYVADAEAADPT